MINKPTKYNEIFLSQNLQIKSINKANHFIVFFNVHVIQFYVVFNHLNVYDLFILHVFHEN